MWATHLYWNVAVVVSDPANLKWQIWWQTFFWGSWNSQYPKSYQINETVSPWWFDWRLLTLSFLVLFLTGARKICWKGLRKAYALKSTFSRRSCWSQALFHRPLCLFTCPRSQMSPCVWSTAMPASCKTYPPFITDNLKDWTIWTSTEGHPFGIPDITWLTAKS